MAGTIQQRERAGSRPASRRRGHTTDPDRSAAFAPGAPVAELITDQTGVTLPPGLLQSGQHDVFAISARKSGRRSNREVLPQYT